MRPVGQSPQGKGRREGRHWRVGSGFSCHVLDDCVLRSSRAEPLTPAPPNVTVFRDRVLKVNEAR